MIRIKTSKGTVNIKEIEPPYWRVGNSDLNEYELRWLMLQVRTKVLSVDIANELAITDRQGVLVRFDDNGQLASSHAGLAINYEFTLAIIKRQREEEEIFNKLIAKIQNN